VEKLLINCDRNTGIGRRDYAVLCLLARLGLRAGEVANMTLDDIDWEAGVVTIHGKGGRIDQLPIPHDVGEALVAYLLQGRPTCQTRRIFVRAQAPLQGFTDSSAIGDIVCRALARARLNPVLKGAHLLRHSLATNLLLQGASLAEIGEILGHLRASTTEIYAKVDVVALRALAKPWPGGEA
jgi:site-specific recombinase XerD